VEIFKFTNFQFSNKFQILKYKYQSILRSSYGGQDGGHDKFQNLNSKFWILKLALEVWDFG